MFQAFSGGCNAKHPTSFFMSRPNGLDNYLLLIVKSPAHFCIDGTEFDTESDSLLIIPPNVPYQYHSLRGNYVNDWLHFSCDERTDLFPCHIPLQTPVHLENSHRLTVYLQQIFWENNYTPDEWNSRNVDLLMQVLFCNLGLACQEPQSPRSRSPYDAKLQNFRLSMQAEPYKKYSAEETARFLGISASYFQHLYTGLFHESFQNDVIRLRIEYAQELILNTNLTIARIAEMCGYSSEVHFYRQFKNRVGMQPTEYRASHLR